MCVHEKFNASEFDDALLKEAKGLRVFQAALQDNTYLHIPRIVSVDPECLVMDEVESVVPNKEQFETLAYGLATLHAKSYEQYGLDEDNYIGLNPQKNTLTHNWGAFFVEYRLGFQISLIKDVNVRERFEKMLEELSLALEAFLNENTQHPSLVHGDLWSGNVLFDTQKVYIIDPAYYYGDREVDIAMSEMFGGFDEGFYAKYDELLPLSQEYPLKKQIYNLYHYLNHYNLFGRSYLYECEDIFTLLQKEFG